MIAGTHLYTWLKRDSVEQSFLSKTTRRQRLGSNHRPPDQKSNAPNTRPPRLHFIENVRTVFLLGRKIFLDIFLVRKFIRPIIFVIEVKSMCRVKNIKILSFQLTGVKFDVSSVKTLKQQEKDKRSNCTEPNGLIHNDWMIMEFISYLHPFFFFFFFARREKQSGVVANVCTLHHVPRSLQNQNSLPSMILRISAFLAY